MSKAPAISGLPAYSEVITVSKADLLAREDRILALIESNNALVEVNRLARAQGLSVQTQGWSFRRMLEELVVKDLVAPEVASRIASLLSAGFKT